jgi:hypothetical protein
MLFPLWSILLEVIYMRREIDTKGQYTDGCEDISVQK